MDRASDRRSYKNTSFAQFWKQTDDQEEASRRSKRKPMESAGTFSEVRSFGQSLTTTFSTDRLLRVSSRRYRTRMHLR